MALRLAGEEIAIQEKIETIVYQPGLQDSGDLEPATKTVTATAKPGAADYTTSLTLAAPDSRLAVRRLALRGNIHIDSFGGVPAATRLFCTVECNGVEKVSARELTSAGADNFFAVDITANFNIGSANELKVYLWVDQGNAVISVCQLWLGIGSCSTTGYALTAVAVSYKGLMHAFLYAGRVGSGGSNQRLTYTDPNNGYYLAGGGELQGTNLVSDPNITLWTSVATDICYLTRVMFTARSTQ